MSLNLKEQVENKKALLENQKNNEKNKEIEKNV